MSGHAGCLHTVANLAEVSGGPSRVVPAMCEALARAGADVTLATVDDGRPMILPRGPVATRLAVSPAGFGALLLPLPRPPAVLHDHGLWRRTNRAAAAAARRGRLPYLVSTHGMVEPAALAHHGGRKRVGWALFQHGILERAAVLVASAEPERATLRRRFPRAALAVVPNGVEIPATDPAPRRDAGPATCLFLSRLHPIKNLVGLVEAWALVVADPAFDRWTLSIAGPDEAGQHAVVAAAIARLGLAARVTLAGPVADADKAAVFAAADLFVLPSFSENFGIVAAEALAHGIPVVASTGTPWSDLASRGCGWWVAPDAAALAGALREAMRLPAAARDAMGARGRAWMARDFGWDAIGARLLGIYDWLAAGAARPDCIDG